MLDRSDPQPADPETSVLLQGSGASQPDKPPFGVPCIPKPSPLVRSRRGTQFPTHTRSSSKLSWQPPCCWIVALLVSGTYVEIVSSAAWRAYRTPPSRSGRQLRAQPASDRPPGLRMIANHAQRRGDGNRQNQSHAAPHPAPEEQRNRYRHGIQTHAPPDQL